MISHGRSVPTRLERIRKPNPVFNRKRLKFFLLWCGRNLGLFWLSRRLASRGILIIGWHGVSIGNEHERFPDFFVSRETLRRRLSFLKDNYEFISLDEAVTQIKNGKIKPRQVVLTFDDGFYNFASSAAPVLNEFGATATVYLLSSHMESQEPFQAPLIRDIIQQSPLRQVGGHLDGCVTPFQLRTDKDRSEFATMALKHLSTLPMNERTQYVAKVAERLDVDLRPFINSRIWQSLNKSEVRQLADKGFSMQLHGHDHLNAVTYADQLKRQILQCRRGVEAATRQPSTHYCYPTGMWQRSGWPDLRSTGVQSATTTRMGPNFAQTPLLSLRRVLDSEEQSQLDFEFNTSFLRWWIHVILHRAQLTAPSEKLLRNREDGKVF